MTFGDFDSSALHESICNLHTYIHKIYLSWTDADAPRGMRTADAGFFLCFCPPYPPSRIRALEFWQAVKKNKWALQCLPHLRSRISVVWQYSPISVALCPVDIIYKRERERVFNTGRKKQWKRQEAPWVSSTQKQNFGEARLRIRSVSSDQQHWPWHRRQRPSPEARRQYWCQHQRWRCCAGAKVEQWNLVEQRFGSLPDHFLWFCTFCRGEGGGAITTNLCFLHLHKIVCFCYFPWHSQSRTAFLLSRFRPWLWIALRK